MVVFFDTSYLRFLAVSIAVHSAIFLILYPARSVRMSDPENITVSILETPEIREPKVAQIPKSSPAPPARKPPVAAKAVSPRPQARAQALPPEPKIENHRFAPGAPATASAPAPARSEPAEPREADTLPREIVPEQSVSAERPLPTMKELLPPLTWSSDTRGSAAVSLDTRDPVYVSYFTKIKQRIESQWEYPELALRYGLQGRLFLEFTIGPHGQLEGLRLLRSSGSQLLDEEALRAIRAAAPFPPIPHWIRASPLSISAAMEYHDNRVNYHSAR